MTSLDIQSEDRRKPSPEEDVEYARLLRRAIRAFLDPEVTFKVWEAMYSAKVRNRVIASLSPAESSKAWNAKRQQGRG